MSAPSNQVMIQGQTVASADYLNTLVEWVPSIAQLRGFIGTSNMTIILLGGTALNDSLQGTFYWNPTSTAADDSNNVIVPTGVTQGAWIRRQVTGAGVIFPTTGTVVSSCGSSYVALGAFTLQLQSTASVTKSCQINVFAYAATVTIALASGTDKINGGTAGASLILPQGMQASISTDGAGNYYATIVMAAASTQAVASGTVTAVAGTNYVASGAFTLDLPSTLTLSKNWFIQVFAQSGAVSVVLLRGADTINGLSSLTISQNYYAVIGTDGNGHFYATTTFSAAGTYPSSVASFTAVKSGNQSVSSGVTTKVTWQTATFNIGGYFSTANGRWTPPAGRVMLMATVQTSATYATVGDDSQSVYIFKNGVGFLEVDYVFTHNNGGPWGQTMQVYAVDQCNGADYYEIFVNNSATSPSVIASAAGPGTYTGTMFSGTQI